MMKLLPAVLISLIFLSSTAEANTAVTITVTNECPFPIWPATAPNTGHPIIASGGFLLPSGHTRHITTPPDWSGRIWGRTHCHFPSTTTTTACLTGDCGGRLSCSGLSGMPPATLVEVTLRSSSTSQSQPSFYDVSVVDGYNLPVHVGSKWAGSNCSIGGCFQDLKQICPRELRVVAGNGEVVACKSGCLAFDNDRFCCRGVYGTPENCGPTVYSQLFKRACPWYVSYAFDDKGGSHLSPSAIVSCMVEELVVTFCPNRWGGSGDLFDV